MITIPDFPIETADAAQRMLMEDFLPERWKTLNEKKKIRACQRVENSLAGAFGREPYRVIPSGNLLNYGSADYYGRTIKIRLLGTGPFSCLDTVVHESRHADQYKLIDELEKHKNAVGLMIDMDETERSVGFLSESMKKARAEAVKEAKPLLKKLEAGGLGLKDIVVMKWEAGHYKDAASSFFSTGSVRLHSMQLLEVDAVMAGAEFLSKNRAFFDRETGFIRMLSEKEKELGKLRKFFSEDSTVKKWIYNRKKGLDTEPANLARAWETEVLRDIYAVPEIEKSGLKCLSGLLQKNPCAGSGYSCSMGQTARQSCRVVSLREVMEENAGQLREKKHDILPQQPETIKLDKIKNLQRKM